MPSIKHLTFSVLCREPLTSEETAAVKAGIDIAAFPVLKRWAARDKRNKLKDVLFIEPATAPVTSVDAIALAKCHNECARRHRARKRN